MLPARSVLAPGPKPRRFPFFFFRQQYKNMLNCVIGKLPKLIVFREGLQITRNVFAFIHHGMEQAKCLFDGIKNSKIIFLDTEILLDRLKKRWREQWNGGFVKSRHSGESRSPEYLYKPLERLDSGLRRNDAKEVFSVLLRSQQNPFNQVAGDEAAEQNL
jgi:hypothetical protein